MPRPRIAAEERELLDRTRRLIDRSQEQLAEFLRSEIDLGFTMLKLASSHDPPVREMALVRQALGVVHRMLEQVRGPRARQEIQREVDRLDRAFQSAMSGKRLERGV